MSILIKGMEMPPSCDDCFLPLRYCPYAMKPDGSCPLVPVPPHGDLIDRDVVRGSIKPWSPEDERNGCTFDTVKKLMHTMLDRASTIIPAEEGEPCQF